MMLSSIVATVLAAGTAVSAAACRRAQSVSMTPHDAYSSSVGVPGCLINTNHALYWPMPVDCNNFCVKISHQGRSVYAMHVDQSGAAFDVSYATWGFLVTGQQVTENPVVGGGVVMDYEFVDPENCAPLLLDNGKFPLSASTSMNFLTSCLAQPNSYVAKNYVLYNLVDSQCKWGFEEQCTLDLAKSNQATCPHQLGLTTPTNNLAVVNVQYSTGKLVTAT